jgi:hypothetical protein
VALRNLPNFERLEPKPETLGRHLRRYMRLRGDERLKTITYPFPIRIFDHIAFAELRLPVGITPPEVDRVCAMMRTLPLWGNEV